MKGKGQIVGRSASCIQPQGVPVCRCAGPVRAPQPPQPPLLDALLTLIFSKANEASIFAVRRSLMHFQFPGIPWREAGISFSIQATWGLKGGLCRRLRANTAVPASPSKEDTAPLDRVALPVYRLPYDLVGQGHVR